MKQQVTKLVIKSAILLVVLVVCDRIIGTGLEHLFYQQTHGDDYTTLYALTKAEDDILVFGTSRASHHYNARLLVEETGKTCFNAGRDEMEIPYTNALLKPIFKRHKPQLVIVDIGPMELSGNKQVVYERVATVLMPYLNRYPVFDSTIAKAGVTELWKIKASKIYAYNSKLGSAFQNAYTNMGHSSDMGYEPLYKTIDTAVYKESIWKDIDKDLPLSRDYISTLISIIDQAKANEVQLVLCISPFYFHHNFSANSSYNRIKKTAKDYNIPLLDFTNDPEFTGQPLLFNDDVHLNDDGAGIYTSKVAAILLAKGIINNNK